MSRIVLVTGGARSGKSRFAESLAGKYPSVTYIATAVSNEDDAEMKERIKRHRESRPSFWHTFEAYRSLSDAVGSDDAYLLDCLTVMTSNIMFEDTAEYERIPADIQDFTEHDVKNELSALINTVRSKDRTLVIVTNEVGDGLVPENHISRVFRDISGRVNQYAASLADEVYLTVCGIPVKIKP